MANQFSTLLGKEVRSRFSDDAVNMPYSEWICKNTTLKGLPFSFKNFGFQKKIIDDMHPNLSVIKISQIGATECQIRKACAFLARNRGMTLMFTFPTEPMLRKQAQTRIQPMLEGDKVFSLGAVRPIRSIEVNQIGSSFLILAPATESSATGQPADVMFNDEVDLSDEHILALLLSRLQGSNVRIRQQFSTPTFSGYGIDASYEMSDQQEYFIKCQCCNHWQVPRYAREFINLGAAARSSTPFPDEIELDELDPQIIDKYEIDVHAITVDCERCANPLDLRAGQREWVAKYPNRVNNRGYRVRTFSVANLPPSYIIQQLIEYRKNDFLRGWYNTVLGETYDKGDVRLTDVQLNPCFKDENADTAPYGSYFIGIDVGSICYISVGSSTNLRSGVCIHHVEAVPLDGVIERVADLDAKYAFAQGMIDQFPEQLLARSLFEMTNGRIIPCAYRGSIEIADKIEVTKNVQVDRTNHIDTLVKVIKDGKLFFYNYKNNKEILKTHLKDMVRDTTPEKPAVWRKLTGQDHYFHSLAFLTTAIKYYTNEFTGYKEETEKSTVYFAGQTLMQPTSDLFGRAKARMRD